MKKIACILLAVVLCFSALSACTKTNMQNNTTVAATTAVTTAATSEGITKFDTAAFIKIVKQRINDDVWYNGKDSSYYDFISNSSAVKIYYRPDDTTSTDKMYAVFFEKRFKDLGSKFKGTQYFVVEFSTGNKGYNELPAGDFQRDSIKEINDFLKELGFKYMLNSYITFDKLTEPKFAETTDTKRKVITEIESNLLAWMKDWKMTGKYKVTIKNFNLSDYTTYIILENSKTNWVIDVNLETASIHKYINVGVDISQYTVNQYKKVAVLTKKIVIN